MPWNPRRGGAVEHHRKILNNHRILAWPKGKSMQALIPHIGNKKCQKSLIARFRQ